MTFFHTFTANTITMHLQHNLFVKQSSACVYIHHSLDQICLIHCMFKNLSTTSYNYSKLLAHQMLSKLKRKVK